MHQIAEVLRLEGPSVRQSAFSVVRTTKQYIHQLHIPNTIEAAALPGKISRRALDEMAEAAYNDSCTRTNPRACSV